MWKSGEGGLVELGFVFLGRGRKVEMGCDFLIFDGGSDGGVEAVFWSENGFKKKIFNFGLV